MRNNVSLVKEKRVIVRNVLMILEIWELLVLVRKGILKLEKDIVENATKNVNLV